MYRLYKVTDPKGITVNDQHYMMGEFANIPEEYVSDFIKNERIEDPERKPPSGLRPENIRGRNEDWPRPRNVAEPTGNKNQKPVYETGADGAVIGMQPDPSRPNTGDTKKDDLAKGTDVTGNVSRQTAERTGLPVEEAEKPESQREAEKGAKNARSTTDAEASNSKSAADMRAAGDVQTREAQGKEKVGKPGPGVKATEK